MKLKDLLDSLADDAPPRSAGGDVNLELLRDRLRLGLRVHSATHHAGGVLGLPGPCVLLKLGMDGADPEMEIVPVQLGARTQELLLRELGHVPVETEADPASAAGRAPDRALSAELLHLFESTATLDAEKRAARLMAWIMERIDAGRCALVPFDAGCMGSPLAFQVRGVHRAPATAPHLPQRVLDHVARTRQPLVSHDVHEGGPIAPAGSLARQRIRSYMAVPVIFQGDLLGIAYVDRVERPRKFSADEQATFTALAYDLARPLLALRERERERDYAALRDELLERGPVDAVVSPSLDAVLERARALAPHVDENLLILGETGAGKEWLARQIHELSGRRGRFVPINVSALPAELFESELMGSLRGAFTGAVDRPGRIAEAEGGTLFLDEIGDLELRQQVKLLRFLQDRSVAAVGGRGERNADVRVMAATNRPVQALVVEGSFRADLLHRFAPALVMPPLRSRREEILPLADAWIAAKARQRGIRPPTLTDGARALLLAHPWPGNVRQLQMVLSHALLLARDGRIDEALLSSLAGPAPSEGGAAGSAVTWPDFLAQQQAREAEWLRSALEAHAGNVEATSRDIACPHTTLRNALRRHGLHPSRGGRSGGGSADE